MDPSSIEIGDRLPEVVTRVDPVQMFFFSAATNDGHRIHFDRTWTVEVEGFEDLVVHGGIQAALMTRMVTDWAGPWARLARIWWQNRAIAYPSMDLTFRGTVAAKRFESDRWSVDVDCVEASGETVLMTGGATVVFNR